MNAEAMLAREETEQRVIEAKIRERAQNVEASSDSSSDVGQGQATSGSEHSSHSGFGSSLEQNERIASLRARSSSLSDHENAEAIPEEVLRSSFAMTPEERRMLEDEMRAQHSHPLSLRLEAEAEERRIHNEREFNRNNPNQFMDSRHRSRRYRTSHEPRRNWNQIVEAFERGGHGEVNSLDDLVVLEAAMILSMEEEARRRGTGHAMGNGESNEPFDANRHATEGFPLVRSILSGRQQASRGEDSEDQNQQIQSSANSLYSRRRGRNSLLRAGYASSEHDNDDDNGSRNYNDNDNALDTALDTAGLLMRGISEDDQLAMAIAASLQDQRPAAQQRQDHGGEEQHGRGDEGNTTENNEENGSSDADTGANNEQESYGPEATAAIGNVDGHDSGDRAPSNETVTDDVQTETITAESQRANVSGDSLEVESHGQNGN